MTDKTEKWRYRTARRSDSRVVVTTSAPFFSRRNPECAGRRLLFDKNDHLDTYSDTLQLLQLRKGILVRIDNCSTQGQAQKAQHDI